MLRSYRKSFEKDDIAKAAKLLTAAGIHFDYSVLFGGPGENMDTVRETLDFLQEVPQMVFFRAGIRIFKGTDLERQAREEGVLQENHDMLSPTYYLSKDLGEHFMEWLDRQCEPRENWFTITKAARQGLVRG
jgi:radical SAM superfamily enzyme